MFHKAVDLSFKDGTVLELTFQSGEVKQYDMACMFEKYPMLKALQNRELFTSGKLMGAYGIIWSDNLDIEVETIYEGGITIRMAERPFNMEVAYAVSSARAKAGKSQKELSELTGIDQSDISKIERGVANPSINTLNRIATALGAKLSVSIDTELEKV